MTKSYLKISIKAIALILLISVFIGYLNKAEGQSTDIVTIDDMSYASGKELHPGRAMLRSFVLPGWGQRYVDRSSWRRGQFHLGADVLLISTWIYLHTSANSLEGNMYTHASAYAGINLRTVDRRLEIAVGNYLNLAEYNDAQLRSRNWDRILEETPQNQWNWNSNNQRIEYVLLRDRMERARQQIPAVLSLMILNRVVSGVNAFIQARNHNQNLPVISFSIPVETGGSGAVASLHFRF